jgi:adenosylcobyric acid synthase
MAVLFVVGTGPGTPAQLTFEARSAIESAEVVVGYGPYLEQMAPLLEGKELVSTGMTHEVERCREALRLAAAGRTVALLSGGDAGIYGMAGLVLELAEELVEPPEIEVIAGVSAVQAAAARLGAPLMHDFAVISLSDLLTPWSTIERRLVAAASADFVVALYNPRSRGRQEQIVQAQRILLAARLATTPVGIVRNAGRPGEERLVTTLAEMLDAEIDMSTLVIIGNSATFVDRDGRMVTPRGYGRGNGGGVQGSSDLPRQVTACGSGALMVGGTGSDVGKSVLTAGLCRILARRGVSVAPFKSQNMALNSAVTPEGGEIGRAQALQAEACRIPPHVDMNPVLLKPTGERRSQVIVQGKVVGTMDVASYNAYKPEAFCRVRESFDRLRSRFDMLLIEGAGSIAEINLKAHDIANLKVAEMAGCPVLLVADIDRGGVFAQIVGTLELLEPQERARIAGVIINKFRGDPSLLAPGIDFVQGRTGVPVLGVVPWFDGFRLPAEDSVALTQLAKGNRGKAEGAVVVGVIQLPRISNFTDFDPLLDEEDVILRYIQQPEELAGVDLLIIPGSKATLSDREFLRTSGLDQVLIDFPGVIAGICGGYQLLGGRICDPLCMESELTETTGLGLLDVATVMGEEKTTHQVTARLLTAGAVLAPGSSQEISGYEIHLGETTLGPTVTPFARLQTRSGGDVEHEDGAVSPDGRVFGTYLHGIFHNDSFRTALLNRLRRTKGLPERPTTHRPVDPLDQLADHLERHLDMERIFELCGVKTYHPPAPS